MSPDQIIAALALLMAEPDPAFETLRQGGYDDRYPVTVAACPETTSPLDIEGQTILCGTVSVPENYDAPDGRRVPLRFVLGRATSTQPFDDAVVYLHGGPAGGALGGIDLVTDTVLADHRAHRDIVSFDQRAAMLSSTTVRCYDEMAAHLLDIARASENIAPPEGEAPFALETILAPCVEELYASDADLPAYNTQNNARDVRAVMSALGYPTYNILGISYGTRLALEVLRTAPEGVRSVIIDGVAPTNVRLYDDLVGPHVTAMEAHFDQCAADAACAGAYPDLRATFAGLGEALAATPIPASRGQPPITAALFYSLVGARGVYSQTWLRNMTAYLPRIITELSQGDPTTFDWYLQTYMEPNPPTPDETLDAGGARLQGDERALALSILHAADAMSDQSDAVVAALDQLKHDVATNARAVSVAEAFDRRVTAALTGRPLPEIAAAIESYARFQTSEPSRETIAGWIEQTFQGPDRYALLSLVSAMTDDDVARTFDIAATDLGTYEALVESTLGLYIYACQEDFPYNSRDGGEALLAESPFADVMAPALEPAMKQIYDACALFEPAPQEGFHDPVVSDVPVLVVGGTNDGQTSWTWSELAAETLSDSQVVILPNSGHGSSLYSACGRDMNAKFILDPTASLDTSCVDDLTPTFVLPDAPLP